MILITGVFYIFFGARTDLVLTMFLVISVFVSQRLPMLGIKKFLSSNVVNKFVWILSGISVGTVIFINQNGVFYDAINKLLSSRLDIFEFYYRTVGMHLLPQKITNFFLGSTFAGMDNAYVFASIYEGVISLFIFCLFEQIIGERIRKQYIGVIIAYISILLMGLSESLIIYPFINFFVVFWNQGHVDNNDVDGEYLDEKNIKNNADI